MSKKIYFLIIFVLATFSINGQTVTGSYLRYNYPSQDTSIITLNSDNTFTLYQHIQANVVWWSSKMSTLEDIYTVYGTWSQVNDSITTHPKKIRDNGENKKHRLPIKSFFKDKDRTQFILEGDCLYPLEYWTSTNKENFKYCKIK